MEVFKENFNKFCGDLQKIATLLHRAVYQCVVLGIKKLLVQMNGILFNQHKGNLHPNKKIYIHKDMG